MHTDTLDRCAFELHFQPLANAGRALVFPCDAEGRVDMDTLGARALCDYLFARAFIGREFGFPRVRTAGA